MRSYKQVKDRLYQALIEAKKEKDYVKADKIKHLINQLRKKR